MCWYYKFLVRRPFSILLGVTVLSSACIIVSFVIKDFPDFSDPTLGFQARGTDIGQRLAAWRNLIDETRPSGKLVADPNDILHEENTITSHSSNNKDSYTYKKRKKKKNKDKLNFKTKLKVLKEYASNGTLTSLETGQAKDYEQNDSNLTLRNENWEYGRNLSFVDANKTGESYQNKEDTWMSLKYMNLSSHKIELHEISDGFCESPDKQYSHFVVERRKHNLSESLFEVNALLAMCQLEQDFQEISGYESLCQKNILSDDCCRPWSLPNYIALLANKTSCFEIESKDVRIVGELLLNCFEYFRNFKLSSDCAQLKCRAPIECTQYNAVYNIFHFLTDMDFVNANQTNLFLSTVQIFLPIGKTTKSLEFYHHIEKSNLENELVKVVAMDMGLKNILFDECLLTDGWLVGLGGIFVMICMWMYTGSFFVTVMTVIAVVFSLGIAYFIYTLILEMSFFPFMNLLAVVVIIGIGADDAFIFVKIWECTLTERMKVNLDGTTVSSVLPDHSKSFGDMTHTEKLNNLMATTLRHSAISMFVTSVTTAAAFYASNVSSITSVKCFGIFAGTAIISNFLLMITWLPASMSITERLSCKRRNINYNMMSLVQKFNQSIKKFGNSLENQIINGILKFSHLWILLFGIIGVLSGIIVFYWPKLQLPESSDFQLFVSHHPFELYEKKYRDQFWFEKMIPAIDNFKLPLRFVWGVLPIDNGDYSNPYSSGQLYFDNNFNITTIEAQKWLLTFCKRLKLQPFYQASFGMILPNCFIENFISWMNRECVDRMDNVDRTPCCEISKFPYEMHIFNLCLPQSITSLYATPIQYFIPGVAGPKFGKNLLNASNDWSSVQKSNGTPIVKALVVEFESNTSYTMSFVTVQKFVAEVEQWFGEQLLTAPQEMQGGWFTSELDFYDLQQTLSTGTTVAICVAMCVSLCILLVVTLNILISVYVIVTVSFTILTTVAILVLLGWKLNILESVAVSTAIGLAVDFSLHYGIHYQFSANSDRVSSTIFALRRMMGPTAMAATTTGLAGAVMLASKVLPYIQIGIFLVVVMTVSWMYSTFFLMSLLKHIGPQYGFMQFRYPNFLKISKAKGNTGGDFSDRLQNHGIVSEQLLTPSSTAVGELLNSESHELDSLASSSIIKQIDASDFSRNGRIDYGRPLLKRRSTDSNYRSPSAGSAITVVILPDDPDVRI